MLLGLAPYPLVLAQSSGIWRMGSQACQGGGRGLPSPSAESSKPLCGYQPRSPLDTSPGLMLPLRNPSWAMQRGWGHWKVHRMLGSHRAGLFKSQLPHLSPRLPPTSSLRLPSWQVSAASRGPSGEGQPLGHQGAYIPPASNKRQLVPTAGPHTTLTANSGGPGGHLLFSGSVPALGGERDGEGSRITSVKSLRETLWSDSGPPCGTGQGLDPPERS